jgi:hypothetical protein
MGMAKPPEGTRMDLSVIFRRKNTRFTVFSESEILPMKEHARKMRVTKILGSNPRS